MHRRASSGRASIARSIGGWLVRSYPKPWRGRYEDEVLALLDESSVRWRDVADLARGLVVERVRATFEPGDRPGLTVLSMAAAMVLLAVALTSSAAAVGWVARSWFGPIPRGLAATADLLTGTVLLILMFPGVVHSKIPRLRAPRVWLGVAMSVVALSAWAAKPVAFHGLPLPGMALFTTPWMFFIFSSQLGFHGSWSRIPTAVRQLNASKHDLKWALMELERCERLATEGFAAPLEEARASLARIHQSREEALATLHSLGYRAKFR